MDHFQITKPEFREAAQKLRQMVLDAVKERHKDDDFVARMEKLAQESLDRLKNQHPPISVGDEATFIKHHVEVTLLGVGLITLLDTILMGRDGLSRDALHYMLHTIEKEFGQSTDTMFEEHHAAVLMANIQTLSPSSKDDEIDRALRAIGYRGPMGRA